MLSPNPRILFVDDDENSCEMISLMLHLADDSYAVTAVSSVEKALALLESESVDLFILDYALPEMTGAEMCRNIRQTDSRTPILFYSAMSRDIDREKALSAGANEYLVKPNDMDKLAETVKRLLAENSAIFKDGSSVKSEVYDRLF